MAPPEAQDGLGCPSRRMFLRQSGPLWLLGLALVLGITSGKPEGRRSLLDYDPTPPGSSSSVILEDRRQRVETAPEIDWGSIGNTREGHHYCVPLLHGGNGCTLSPARMSFLLDAVRNTQHAHHYKEYTLHEMQCRRRSHQNCGAEGLAAYVARSQAVQDKVHLRNDPDDDFVDGDDDGRGEWGAEQGAGAEQEREEYMTGEYASSLDIGKCRWSQEMGCIAHLSRISMETMVNVCKIEAIDEFEDVGVRGFEEEFSYDKMLRNEAARQCERHNHTRIGCRAALGGACQWFAPPPTEMAASPREASLVPRTRLMAPPSPSLPPPPPPSPFPGTYEEPGSCVLRVDNDALYSLHKSLNCQANEELMDAYMDYNSLNDICSAAENQHLCMVLALSEPCHWTRHACRPSFAVLLAPLGSPGLRISEDLRTCEGTTTINGNCTPGVIPAAKIEVAEGVDLHEDKRVHPVVILLILGSLLVFGVVTLRKMPRFSPLRVS